jgi:zinc resistance-associated protein
MKMKWLKSVLGLGLALLIVAMAAPAFASTPVCGGAYGPGYYQGYGPGYSTLGPNQRSRLDQLNHKFYEETSSLQNEIWAKSGQLDRLRRSSNANPEEVKRLQKEISGLKTKLTEKRGEYNLEARKVNPGARLGSGYDPGYGPAYCWNY